MKQKKLFKELRNALDQAWIQATKPISDLSLAQRSCAEKEMNNKLIVKIGIQMRHRSVNETKNKLQRELVPVEIVAL
jgi:hypothetical protein